MTNFHHAEIRGRRSTGLCGRPATIVPLSQAQRRHSACGAVAFREVHLAIKSYMLIICLLAVSGCTVGPDYHRPSLDLQHQYVAPEADNSTTAAMTGLSTSRP